MNIRFDFKKVQIIAPRLVTLLAILFLCAPIGMLNADSTTEPQTTLHKRCSFFYRPNNYKIGCFKKYP